MSRQAVRMVAASLAALMLGSCSKVCDILAVVIDGRLAFIVDPSSDWQPDCISAIQVQADDGEPKAIPAKGDDRLLVLNGGAYWWKTFNLVSCENPFPIFYGAPLKGPPFYYSDGKTSSVEAKPLRVGAIYSVNTTSNGGYGYGMFRITSDLRVENFRDDPTPRVENAEGYDVTDYSTYVTQAEDRTYMP